MFDFVALTFLGNETLAPTSKIFKSSSGSLVEGYEILQNVSIQYKDVFEVSVFDLLIGHPIENLFLDVPRLGSLDTKLGKDTSSILISRSTNSLTEPIPICEPFQKVMVTSPLGPPESVTEKHDEHFIIKDDNSGVTFHLFEDKRPSSPKLGPLSAGPQYPKSLEKENPWARNILEALTRVQEKGFYRLTWKLLSWKITRTMLV
jgi:hypothetical protein